MAIAGALGKADLFITFTCNPRWIEITRELRFNQEPNDRPDLIVRVFKLKLDALMDDILKRHIFGRTRAHIAVIEFQKRGLPHAHVLIWLDEPYKPRTPDDYDSIVSAELPDPALYPRLFVTIARHNIHGPCGPGVAPARQPPCWDHEAKRCTKHFPKAFCETTADDDDGYPRYRRRNDGRTVEVGGILLDNRCAPLEPSPPFRNSLNS